EIFLTNKKFEELTGKSEVVGMGIASISEVFGRIAKDTLKDKNTSITDITINENLILRISSSLVTHDNTVLGVIFLLRDITVEKEVDSMKTNFISTVSHELRTPLTSVLGFASNARSFYRKDIIPMIPKDNKKLNRRSKTIYENLCIIISEGERLTRLIDDVLDIAKMEAGKIEWNIQNVNIIDVCRQSLAAVSGYPKSSNVNVAFDPPDTVADVVGDPDRLVQVIANLMSNALKFTEEGSVTLKVEPMKNNVKVSVIDSGKGINENELKDVFEKFKQVGDDILTDKPKGTGLGLPICKEIVEHIGGKIWAESELGVGSSFCFTLDYAQKVITQEEPSAPVYNYKVIDEVTKKVVHKKKSTTPQILIVDDDINTRKLLRQELEMIKCNVLEAKNGLEAIAMTKNKCDYLDLIILDIMMPEIDGFEVLGAIKTNEKLYHIPIIVLSAYDVENKVYRLGAEDFISKPIDKDKFISSVTKHLSESGEKKVLIIDNDKNIIKAITDVLVGRGCVVRGVSNSEDGLKMAQSESPDIIMFGMESQDIEKGLEIIRELRLDKKTQHIYIILIVDSMDKDLQKTAELLKV
ncbi:MAG: response regulator, partial [Thermodesulfobacteriota bacterium]